MSAPAETVAAAPVEDVKPTETPAAEPVAAPAPAAEEPKTEEAAPAAAEAPAVEEPKAEVSLLRRVTRFAHLTLWSTQEPVAAEPTTEAAETPAAPAEPATEEAKPVSTLVDSQSHCLIVASGRGGPQEGREAGEAQEPRFPRQDSCSLQER